MSNKKINKEEETEKEYQEVSLFKNPITTLRYLVLILSEQLVRFLKFLLGNKIILLIAIAYFLLNFGQGPHKEVGTFKLFSFLVHKRDKQNGLLLFVLDSIRSSFKHRIRNWSSHLRFVLRASHCKGNFSSE
jgi:hypothetical protein